MRGSAVNCRAMTKLILAVMALLLTACDHDPCRIGPKNGDKDITYSRAPSYNYDSAGRCPVHQYTPRTEEEKAPPK